MTASKTLAAICSAALLVPAATAAAKPGAEKAPKTPAPGKVVAETKDKVTPPKAKEKAKVKTVTFVFKGVYAGEGAVKVAKGNGHVKKYRLGGKTLTLDFSAAKLVVDDADGDGVTLADVKAGDKVLVQVRVPRTFTAGDTLTVRKLVDQTRPPVEDDDQSGTEVPATPVGDAPAAATPEGGTPEVQAPGSGS